MLNITVAFKFLPEGTKVPMATNCAKAYNSWCQMEEFRHKAWLMGASQMIKALAAITYTSVISRKAVRMIFMTTALNDLKLKSAYILNAHVHATITEKV